MGISRSAMLQWGELASVVFAAFLLLSDKVTTIRHIFASSAVVAVCPGIRLASVVCIHNHELNCWVTKPGNLRGLRSAVVLTQSSFH